MIILSHKFNQSSNNRFRGNITFYLNIQIKAEEDGDFFLSQNQVISEIVETKEVRVQQRRSDYSKGHHEISPLPRNGKYQKATGKLICIATVTSPEIVSVMGIRFRKDEQATHHDWL